MKPVKHLKITKGMTVAELVKGMNEVGVMGSASIGKAAAVIKAMLTDKQCTVFLGIAGAMIPGGMRKIIHDVLEHVDCFVCTGATLTHDTVEALGFRHYSGSEKADDALLHRKGLDRMWNSIMPSAVYEALEVFVKKNWLAIEGCDSVTKILDVLGSKLPKNSILNICHRRKIPVFCPAIENSGLGLMLWGQTAAGKKLDIKPFADVDAMIKLAWGAKRSGVLYVGGGEPKNYIQQALQFSKPASYGVQITIDKPHYGGSSGAELREGISWGKMKPSGKFVDVYCDATIALPLIWTGVKG